MKRLASWLAWLLPVAALGPLALAHCSSSENTSTGTPDSGTIGTGSSSGGIGSSSGSSGSSSGGSMVIEPTEAGTTPVVDAGSPSGEGGADGSQGPPATPVPEGGAPSDPGSVVCNGAPCDVSSGSTCCYARTDGGSTETCNALGAGCSTSVIACNEAADCKGGICCQVIIGTGLQGSTFCTPASANSCPGASAMYPQGTFQTCRVDDECGKNSDAGALKRCIPQQCTATGTANPPSLKVEACATPLGPGNDAGTLSFVCKRL